MGDDHQKREARPLLGLVKKKDVALHAAVFIALLAVLIIWAYVRPYELTSSAYDVLWWQGPVFALWLAGFTIYHRMRRKR